MPRPTEIPLSRAAQHLAAGRFAEAAGAFRAALHIDPRELRAMLGLADCALARGQRDAAYFHWVEAGRACVERHEPLRALDLFTRAIGLDGSRLEIHLDIAEAELALDRTESALLRLENLAAAYVDRGRADEAAEVLRFVAGVEVSAASGAPVAAVVDLASLPRTETVVCSTILITPDETPFVRKPSAAPQRTFTPMPSSPRVVTRPPGAPAAIPTQHTQPIARRARTASPPAKAQPPAKPAPKSDIAARLRQHAGLPRPAARSTSAPPPSTVATAPHRVAAPVPARARIQPAPRLATREDLDDQRTRLYRLPTTPPT